MSIRQEKCSAPRGAVRTQRFSGGLAPRRRAQPRQRLVQHRAAGGPVVLKALRGVRGAISSWNETRARTGHQHGLVVDRHDPLALAHLLLDEVAEQVAPIVCVA